MKILAIDTTSQNCSVCLFNDGDYYEQSAFGPREHAIRILPQIQTLLKESNLTLASLDAVAFDRGPGSFTGLRLTASVTQAIAFAANKPVIAISSLKALAEQARRLHAATEVLAVIDARMQQVYCGFYKYENDNWTLTGAEEVLDPDQVTVTNTNNYYGIGTGWREAAATLQQSLKPENIIADAEPQAHDIATLAIKEFALGNLLAANQAQPVYIRNKVTR